MTSKEFVIQILSDTSKLDKGFSKAEKEVKNYNSNLLKNQKKLEQQKIKLAKETEKRLKRERGTIVDKALNDMYASDAKTREKIAKNALKELEQQHKKEIKLYKNNEQQKVKLTREYQRKRDKITSQSTKGKRGGGGGVAGVSSGGLDSLGSSATKASGGMGKLTGALTKLPGPAKAVGVAVAAVVGVLASAFKATEKYNIKLAETQRLLSEDQEAKLPEAMNRLQNISATTGQSLDDLQSTFNNLLRQNEKYANDLDGSAKLMGRMHDVTEVFGGSIEETTEKMSKMTDALGVNMLDQEEMDRLLGVVTQSRIEFNDTTIESATIFKSLTNSTEEAVTAMGAVTTVLRESGIASNKHKRILTQLNDALSNTSKASKLAEMGVEGFDSATGKLTDMTKFVETLSKQTAGNLGDIFSGGAKIGVEALIENKDKFSKLYGDLAKETGGAFDDAVGEVEPTMQKHMDRMSAIWNQMMVNLGEGTGMFGTVVGGLNDGLDWLNKQMESSAVTAQRSQEEFETLYSTFTDVNSTVNVLEDSLSRIGTDGAMSATEIDTAFSMASETMNNIKDISPIIAQDMKAIIDNPESRTVESVEKLVELMREAEGVSQALLDGAAIDAGVDAVDALADELDELANKNRSFWERLNPFDSAGTAADVYQGAQEAMEANSRESINALREQTKALRDELKDTTDADRRKEIAENIRDLTDEITEKNTAYATAQSTIAKADEALAKTARQRLDMEVQLAQSSGEKIDLQQRSQEIIEEILIETGREAENMAAVASAATMVASGLLPVGGAIAGAVAGTKGLNDAMEEVGELTGQDAMLAQSLSKAFKDVIPQVEEGAIKIDQQAQQIENAKQAQLQLNNEVGELASKAGEGAIAQLQVYTLLQEQTAEKLEQKDLSEEEISILQEKDALIDVEINKLKDSTGLRVESAQLQEKINNLTSSESQISGVVNNLLMQKLGTEQATVQEKIKTLEAMKVENEQQIENIQTQITGIETQIQAEIEKVEVMNSAIRAQQELSKEKGNTVQSTLVEIDQQKSKLAELKAQIENRKSATAEIDKQIDLLKQQKTLEATFGKQAMQTGAGGGASRSSGRGSKSDEERKAKEEAERQKELAKKRDDAEKAQIKAIEDAKKRRADAEKRAMEQWKSDIARRNKLEDAEIEQRTKLVESLKDMQKQYKQSIKNLRDSLETEVSGAKENIDSIVSQYTEANVNDLLDKASEQAQQRVENFKKTVLGEAESFEEAEEKIRAAVRNLDIERNALKRQMNQLGQELSRTRDPDERNRIRSQGMDAADKYKIKTNEIELLEKQWRRLQENIREVGGTARDFKNMLDDMVEKETQALQVDVLIKQYQELQDVLNIDYSSMDKAEVTEYVNKVKEQYKSLTSFIAESELPFANVIGAEKLDGELGALVETLGKTQKAVSAVESDQFVQNLIDINTNSESAKVAVSDLQGMLNNYADTQDKVARKQMGNEEFTKQAINANIASLKAQRDAIASQIDVLDPATEQYQELAEELKNINSILDDPNFQESIDLEIDASIDLDKSQLDQIETALSEFSEKTQGIMSGAGDGGGLDSIGKYMQEVKSMGNIDATLDKARKELEATGATMEEIGQKLNELEKTLKSQFIVDTIDFAINLTEEAYEAVDDIVGKITEGDTGAAVEAMGDLTVKIGKALLQAPHPLNIAGAVILGVGMITKIVGKIMAMFKKAEKDALEIAQDRAKAENDIIDGYNQQIEAMETLVELGNKALDTAKERADFEGRAGESLGDSSLLPDDIQQWSNEAVVDYKQQRQTNIRTIEDEINAAQWILDNGTAGQIGDFLRSRGLNDRGKNSKRLSEYIMSQQALLTDEKSRLAGVNAELGRRQSAEDTTGIGGEVFQEEQNRLEEAGNRFWELYENALGEDDEKAEGYYNSAMSAFMERENKARQELIDQLQSIPETDEDFIQKLQDAGLYEDYMRMGEMSKEELQAFYAQLLASTDEISEETMALFDGWIGAIDDTTRQQESAVDARLRQLAYEREVLEAQLEKGEITQQEYTDKMVANYKEVLAIQQAQLAEQQDQGASATEILDTKSEILNTEMEIWRLLNAQNKEEDSALQKMIKRRQEAIKLARATGDYSGITQMDSAITGHLRAQGKSEEYIQEFLASLPKFAKGGKVDETGMALVHKNEVIIPESLTREYGISGLDDLQKMYYNNYSVGARALSAPNIFNNVNNWNLNLQLNINNNIDKIDKNNIGLWTDKLSSQAEKQLVQSINNQLMNNKIDLRNSTGV